MKDQVEAPGELPSHWKSAALGEVATIVNGGTPKSRVAAYWDGEVQWLTPKDMGKMEGREVATTPRTITKEGLARSSARLVPSRSIILSTRAPIGHLAINSTPMCFNQGCRGIIPGKDLDGVFLYHFLAANRQELNALGSGTTFKELSATNLRAVEVPLPPLEEQKRIVAVLDQAFAALDRARAHAEANLADARSLPHALAQSELLEPLASGSWLLRPLGEVTMVLDRLRKPITKRDRNPGDVPYYGATGVVDHVADHIFDEDLVLIGEDGARWGSGELSAFPISGKTWVNNHAHVLRPDRNLMRDDFLIAYLNTTDLMPWVSGMTVPKLNQTNLISIPVPLPTLGVQDEVVRRLKQITTASEALAHSYRSKVEDTHDLRQSLLQAAFSGRLT